MTSSVNGNSEDAFLSDLPRRWLIILAVASISIAAGLVYANSLKGTWGLDDYSSIVENKDVHLQKLTPRRVWEAATSEPEGDRWVTNATFALNYYLHGDDPKGFKLINLFIHVFTAMGVFFFLFLFLRAFFLARDQSGDSETNSTDSAEWNALEIAWMTAFLWSLHPIGTQTVNYVVQRSVLLCGMFYVWGLWSYFEGRARTGYKRWGFFVFTGVLYFLSMKSKEVGATLVLAILLVEWLLPDWDEKKKRNMMYMGSALFLIFSLVALYLLGGFDGIWMRVNGIVEGTRYSNRRFTFLERVATEWRVMIFYLSLVVYPGLGRLNLEHEMMVSTGPFTPWTTLPALLCILGLVGLAYRFRRQYSLFAFGIFWFFLHLLITSTVINLELIFEHRVYLASIGPVFIGAVFIARYLPIEFRIRLVWVFLLAGALGWVTYERNRVWYNQVRLYRDAVQKAPDKPRNHGNLGVAYYRRARRMLNEGSTPKEVFPLFLKAVNLHVKTLVMRRNQGYRPIDPVFEQNLDDLLIRLYQAWLKREDFRSNVKPLRKVVEAYEQVFSSVRPQFIQRRDVLLEQLIWLRFTLMRLYDKNKRKQAFQQSRNELISLIKKEPDRARESMKFISNKNVRRRFQNLIDRTLNRKKQEGGSHDR